MRAKVLLLAATLLLAANAGAQRTSFAMGWPITAADNGMHGPVKEVYIIGEGIDDESSWTRTYYYDQRGRLTEYHEWSYGGGVGFILHYTDSRLDSITAANDSIYHEGWFYTYDADGCPTRQIARLYDGNDTIYYTCKDGLIVEERSRLDTTQYRYNADRRMASETVHGATTYFDYDAHGHLTKQTMQNGDFVRTETNTYNAEGNVVEYRQYTNTDNDTLVLQYEYTYDSHGNWMTCTGNEFREEQDIIYYDEDKKRTK
ncbi:MAG: hypothetical protein IJ634_04710 [Bacteroidales bacterium]|nr:hypothetical protein [Bacteroidales bacterium]